MLGHKKAAQLLGKPFNGRLPNQRNGGRGKLAHPNIGGDAQRASHRAMKKQWVQRQGYRRQVIGLVQLSSRWPHEPVGAGFCSSNLGA